MSFIDFLFYGFTLGCFILIVEISQSMVSYYRAKQIAPTAIFEQMLDEMRFPRKIFYLKKWRDNFYRPSEYEVAAHRFSLILGGSIVSMMLVLMSSQFYSERTLSALVGLVVTITMLLISRFWMIRRRLFTLKEAASLKHAPRKGREF